MASPSFKRRRISSRISVDSVYFKPLEIKTPLSLHGTFSTVSLVTNKVRNIDGYKIKYKLSSIFDIDKECIEEFQCVPFKRYNTLKTTGVAGKEVTERDVLVYTVEHFLSLITEDITFNKDYKSNLVDHRIACTVNTGYLGLGKPGTWHGEPDARIKGRCNVSSSADVIAFEQLALEPPPSPELPESSECIVDSQGDSTFVEGKKKIANRHMSQLLSTVVVASFTDKNRHPDMNSAVPCILINATTAYVAIYDCKYDILLCSTEIVFQSCDGEIDDDHAFVLWLTVNHRKFLKSLKHLNYSCGLMKFLSDSRVDRNSSVSYLQLYNEMKEKGLDWRSSRKEDDDDDDDDGAYVIL